MASIQSKVFNIFIKIINLKGILKKIIEKEDRKDRLFFTQKEAEKYNIETEFIDNKEVSTLVASLDTPTHILYFHGGQYVIEATANQKTWLKKLFDSTKVNITFVDYPLAPENTCNDTVNMIVKSYQSLSRKYPMDNFVLMGDSAGGGLALVLAQYLRDNNIRRRPGKTILYSPWIDLEMKNPDILKMLPKDLLLDIESLQKSALKYAGNKELSHMYLSPIFSSCDGLGNLFVFYGSDEILAPDISLMKEKCDEGNTKSVFFCYEGMQHDFQLFTFLPESKDVLRKTVEIIEEI